MKQFDRIQVKKPNRNHFNNSHDVKMSGQIGDLMPCLAMECMPGDTHEISGDLFLRFAPMLAPIMHRVDAFVHVFFVPNRILFDDQEDWENFITAGGPHPTPVDVVHPYMQVTTGWTPGMRKFGDYFGITPIEDTPGQTTTLEINPLAISAYQKTYNDYYRNQALIDEVPYALVQGTNNAATLMVMRKRPFEHDYFTAALPDPQKGATVNIPLGDVYLKESWEENTNPSTALPTFFSTTEGFALGTIAGGLPTGVPGIVAAGVEEFPYAYNPAGTLGVAATAINDLREALRLQEFLELNARAGTRYVENIMAHFGVRSSDGRLQRAEYITGYKAPVIISEVLNQTGPTEVYDGTELIQTGNPQGDMAGHGISVKNGKRGKYFCEEHGWIIGIISVRPRTAYQQGVPRQMLRKETYLDYPWPTFAHLGERPVKNAEIFAYTEDDQFEFGYQPMYSEYRYTPSRVAGDFRSTLDFWHMGRKFDNLPVLNSEFINVDFEDFNRIFAVQDDSDKLWMQIVWDIQSYRPLPMFSNPYT